MLKKSMFLLVALIALGCGEEKDGGTTPKDNDTGKVTKDASVKDARSNTTTPDTDDEDASTETGEEAPKNDAGVPSNGKPPAIDDAGSIEVKTPDGGTVVITPGADGGGLMLGEGSCCSEHDTPGCNNAALMVCVCEKNAKCCTEAWTLDCTFIVTQRYCQEGVRECVCDPAGDVQQEKCCSGSWSKQCQAIAETKCEAIPGCF